jgi:glycosyltransferase involved in cell wall biosynthesis
MLLTRPKNMNPRKHIVMLGTSSDAWGGIASVINVYRQEGLFERGRIIYLTTHCTGPAIEKFRRFLCSWLSFGAMLALGRVHVAADTSFWRKACFLLPAFLFRVPTVLHLHAGHFPQFYEHRCNRLAKAAIRYVFDHVDRLVVVSAALKDWAESISANQQVRTKVVTIYNPMPMPDLADFTLRTPTHVLFLGRLGNGKGTYDLLAAIRRIVDRHPNVKVILGGDGEVERTRDAVRQLGLDENVEVRGWVNATAKAQLLAQAAIYVLPSYAEGLPMSVLEAMSTGLVVVATQVGGIPEAVTNGIEGWLVPPGDVDALAQALDSLLSNADVRRRMGMAGRTKAETVFSSKLVIPLIEKLYRQLGAPASDDVAAGSP